MYVHVNSSFTVRLNSVGHLAHYHKVAYVEVSIQEENYGGW